jgi:hypothetical protein
VQVVCPTPKGIARRRVARDGNRAVGRGWFTEDVDDPALDYSPHAIRRMEMRGVTEAEVEYVIARGDKVLQSSTGRWAYEAEVSDRWITVIRRPNGTIHTVALGRGSGEERLLWRP